MRLSERSKSTAVLLLRNRGTRWRLVPRFFIVCARVLRTRERLLCPIALLLIGAIEGRAQQLPIKTYTTADGLPSAFIQSIVRDSRGFLWFCTRNGLSRFDGHRFVTYGAEHGLPAPVINHLLETRGGVYWVATNGGGVCRFNPDAGVSSNGERGGGASLFTTYPVGDGHNSNLVNILYEDRAGRIWAGTDDGLFLLEETNGRMAFRLVEMGKPPTVVRLSKIFSMVEGRDGSLWINSSSGLARRLPDGGGAHYIVQSIHGPSRYVSMLEDGEGDIWMGSRNGLIRFRPETPKDRKWVSRTIVARKATIPGKNSTYQPSSDGKANWYTTDDGLADNYVSALHQSSDDRIWIGTLGGLTEFKDGRFRSYTTAEGLSDNRIRQIAEDHYGNLWLGTSSGAIKLTKSGFISYPSRAAIYSIHEDSAGEIFAVSADGFINRVGGRIVHLGSATPARRARRRRYYLGFAGWPARSCGAMVDPHKQRTNSLRQGEQDRTSCASAPPGCLYHSQWAAC